MNDSLTLTFDPAWPWSSPPVGLPALLLVALALAGLTIWTYRGVAQATPRRVATLIAIRLAALFLVLLMVLRPALASRDELKVPTTLLLVLDMSESMTFQDEYGGLSRWDALRRYLRDAEPPLQKLRDEYNVTTLFYAFAEDLRDFDPHARADGKRTDFGEMLNTLFDKHGKEPYLRGLVILSDGADNGTRSLSIESFIAVDYGLRHAGPHSADRAATASAAAARGRQSPPRAAGSRSSCTSRCGSRPRIPRT